MGFIKYGLASLIIRFFGDLTLSNPKLLKILNCFQTRKLPMDNCTCGRIVWFILVDIVVVNQQPNHCSFLVH